MSVSRLVAAVALLWILCGPALALEPGMVAAAPGAWSFRLGALKLWALRDAGYVTPNDGGDFGTKAGAPAVGALLAAAGLPTDRITLNISALVIRTPGAGGVGRVILLDSGVGAARHGALARSLAMARVSPGEITDILITHSHFDHVGGLVGADGRPAFPKAVIHISAREWAWMQQDAESKALAPAIAAQVRTFEPGSEVLPGITPIALYGHTPGHVGYEIRGGASGWRTSATWLTRPSSTWPSPAGRAVWTWTRRRAPPRGRRRWRVWRRRMSWCSRRISRSRGWGAWRRAGRGSCGGRWGGDQGVEALRDPLLTSPASGRGLRKGWRLKLAAQDAAHLSRKRERLRKGWRLKLAAPDAAQLAGAPLPLAGEVRRGATAV
jgi:glyoxylase-like metal-dependent hydrolase (beta-lactamase superfamily II)